MTHSIIEYALPAQISLSKLRQDIKSKFHFESESTIRLVRIYQDSFDCRLYKNGHEYFIEKYDDQISLFLHPVNSTNHVHILSANKTPVFAHDFKSVVFHKTMKAVLDIRALMSHVVLNIKRRNMALVNIDNKICAQVQFDDISLSSSGHIQKSLGQYLRVLPVKGFEKTVEDICRYIENSLDLNAAKETLLSKVQEITGNNYCPLMEYPHHLLLPEMRADEAVKAILLSELEIIELVESGLIQNIDTEFLHDFRVAIRRTRSILKQIKGVFYKRIIDRYNTTFSWLGKLTGPLRDTHVYLLKLEYYQQQLSEETRPHLEPLRAFLLKHEVLEHKNLVRELAKKRYSNIKSSWREFLTQPVFKKTLLPNADKNIKQVSDAAIWDAYKKVIASGSKIKNDSADEKLHRMRIKCKKLRYLLEFFGDLYPKKQMSVILESLKKLQGMLGDFQDVSVQTTRLRIFETQMEEEGMLTAETLEAMESLVSCLNNIKEDIRKLYMKNYAVLTGKKIKSKFSKLFNTVSEMP